jgi:uncharacterized protein YutE (UPF0331/DUF86 family)
MIKSEPIKERLKLIDETIPILKDLKATPLDKFKDDKKLQMLAERCLELSIQSLLDIAHYIIAQNNWDRSSENKEAILTLGIKGIIPKDFSKRIESMAGLRNLLAHEYLKIDPLKIYKHIQHLEDFREFSRYILEYIKK